MPDLINAAPKRKQTARDLKLMVRGEVARTPASEDEDLLVTVESFNRSNAYGVPASNWSGVLVKGDPVLLGFDESGEEWLIGGGGLGSIDLTDVPYKPIDESIIGNWTFAPAGGNGIVTAEELVNRGYRIHNVLDYGADGVGVADSATAINSAIAAVNASTGRVALQVPAGDYLISGPLDAIEKDNVIVFGAGPATRIKQSDNVGTFFTVGSASESVRWLTISDLSLECTGTPTAHAIVADDGNDLNINRVRVFKVAGVLRLGGVDSCSRVRLDGVTGTVLDGSTLNWFLLNGAYDFRALNCHITSNPEELAATALNGAVTLPAATITVDDTTDFAASGTIYVDGNQTVTYTGKTGTTFTGCSGGSGLIPDGATVRQLSAGGGAYVRITEGDTFYFDNSTFFCQPGPNGVVGKPYAFDIDATAAAVNNLYVAHCTLDGTDTAAYRFRGDSNVTTARNHQFIGNRMETADGRVVDLDHAGGGNLVAQGITFIGNFLNYGNNPLNTQIPFLHEGGVLANDISYVANRIFEKAGAADRGAVFSWGTDGWLASNNLIRKNSTTTTLAVDYIVKSTADNRRYVCQGNWCGAPSIGFFNHGPETGSVTTRSITGNIPRDDSRGLTAAATLTLPIWGGDYRLIRVSGNTTITSISPGPVGQVVTLKFSGTPTVTASASLKLAGGVNFEASADDTLTLISDGSTWREIGRTAGLNAFGLGEAQNIRSPDVDGRYVQIHDGSAADPTTVLKPTVKISRYEEVTIADAESTGTAVGAQPDSRHAALAVEHLGGPANELQSTAIYAAARTESEMSTGRSDACAITLVGEATGADQSTTGVSLSVSAQDTDSRATGLEVHVRNSTGVDGTYSSAATSALKGLGIVAQGENDSGAGIHLYSKAGDMQFAVGIAFGESVSGSGGPARDSTIRDDGAASVSYDCRGVHDHAIQVAAGAGDISLNGALNGSVVLRTKVTGDTDDRFTLKANGDHAWSSGAAPSALRLRRSATSTMTIDDGAGGAAKLNLTGELELDGALNHDGTTVGFYGTAPIAKQTGVAVTAAAIHAALSNLGMIAA